MKDRERGEERGKGRQKKGRKEQEGTGVNRSIFDIGKRRGATHKDRQTDGE